MACARKITGTGPLKSNGLQYVDHTYHDFSCYLQGGSVPERHKKAGSNFPAKLHQVLSEPQFSHIISWMPHGRTFRILDKELLMTEVVPKYFVQTKFESFTRQLSGWGFKRLHKPGRDYGCYYHECFLAGLPLLTWLMKRVKPSQGKLKPFPDGEPDFYAIASSYPLPPPGCEDYLKMGPSQVTSKATTTFPSQNEDFTKSLVVSTLSHRHPVHSNPKVSTEADVYAPNAQHTPSSVSTTESNRLNHQPSYVVQNASTSGSSSTFMNAQKPFHHPTYDPSRSYHEPHWCDYPNTPTSYSWQYPTSFFETQVAPSIPQNHRNCVSHNSASTLEGQLQTSNQTQHNHGSSASRKHDNGHAYYLTQEDTSRKKHSLKASNNEKGSYEGQGERSYSSQESFGEHNYGEEDSGKGQEEDEHKSFDDLNAFLNNFDSEFRCEQWTRY